jgi:hypothetical protein
MATIPNNLLSAFTQVSGVDEGEKEIPIQKQIIQSRPYGNTIMRKPL